MAVINYFLCVLILLSISSRGCSQCSIKNLKVSQSGTGNTVEGKREWKVIVSNNCECTQMDVKLDCNGFETSKAIDPSILSQSGVVCVFNNGQPIAPQSQLNFTYAWDTSFPFTPVSSQIACS